MDNFKVTKVVVDPRGVEYFLKTNKPVRDLISGVANDVKREAEATASAAEKGEGGEITGYAAAGFSVKWEMRSRRPRVIIQSNLNDPETLEKVYWYTQRRDGIAHLRKALYKFTTRGN